MNSEKYLAMRRWIDAGVTVVALPLLAPIGLLAALGIAVIDRQHPTIALQRAGHRRRPLTVVKLRTMRNEPGGGSSITASGDSRITTLGGLLRKWRLDELPQLYAVLRGEMALIGPRPEDPKFVTPDDARWDAVLAARPGIAGLTQIIASRWEEQNLSGDAEGAYRSVALPAKKAIDQWYVENASPAVDWLVVTSLARMMLAGDEWTRAHDSIASTVPEAAVLLSFAMD